jgi:hypothetical protein
MVENIRARHKLYRLRQSDVLRHRFISDIAIVNPGNDADTCLFVTDAIKIKDNGAPLRKAKQLLKSITSARQLPD